MAPRSRTAGPPGARAATRTAVPPPRTRHPLDRGCGPAASIRCGRYRPGRERARSLQDRLTAAPKSVEDEAVVLRDPKRGHDSKVGDRKGGGPEHERAEVHRIPPLLDGQGDETRGDG